MTARQLALIATEFEDDAEATVSANANPSGYWKRIAAAAEELAGETTTANANPLGYMRRATLALESLAGTTGTNVGEDAYVARMVVALEAINEEAYEGSWLNQLYLAIIEFVPSSPFPGPELVPNSDFSSAVGHTLAGAFSISSNCLNAVDTGSDTVTALATLVPGTYRVTIVVISSDTVFQARVAGGTLTAIPSSNSAGTKTVDIVVGTVSNQQLVLSASEATAQIDSWSVVQIA
jgi:hypothetical protein